MLTKRKLAVALFGLGLMAGGLVFLWLARRDDAWYQAQAKAIVSQARAQTPRAQALALRDHLRARVGQEGLVAEGRPVLRATARQTIESGRGFSGDTSRAFVCLAAALGLPAQRVNLYGKHDTVVVEVDLGPGEKILLDPHPDPISNPYFDNQDRGLDQVLLPPDPFAQDYSNINLRRAPVLGAYVQRVRTRQGWLTDLLEDPLRMEACFLIVSGAIVLGVLLSDMILILFYVRRLRSRRVGHDESENGPLVNSGPSAVFPK